MPRRYPETTHVGVKLDRHDLGQLDALVAHGRSDQTYREDPHYVTRSEVLRAGIRVMWALHVANVTVETLTTDVLGQVQRIAGRVGANPDDVLSALVHHLDPAADLARDTLREWNR